MSTFIIIDENPIMETESDYGSMSGNLFSLFIYVQ